MLLESPCRNTEITGRVQVEIPQLGLQVTMHGHGASAPKFRKTEPQKEPYPKTPIQIPNENPRPPSKLPVSLLGALGLPVEHSTSLRVWG